MTTVWNLSRLRYTVRQITGKLDQTQIPDSSSSAFPISATNPPGIDDYINDFYLYDFDEHMRTLQLEDWYYFQTQPNLNTYNLPKNYFSAQGPIYVDGYEIAWYQNPQMFFRIWPQLSFIQNAVATGNGTTGPYTFTLSSVPIQPGTVVFGTTPVASPPLESFSDSVQSDTFVNPVSTLVTYPNQGTLFASSAAVPSTTPSTLNYITGAVTLNFAVAVPNGVSINAHYYPYVASRPRDCLFFQQQFTFKPVPNDVYQIKVMAYQQPTVALASGGTASQFTNQTDSPTFNEWWQMLAYGAALKILIEQGDHEEYQRNKMYFEEAKMLAQRRALKQLSNQRIQTPYSENSGGASWPIFPFY